MKQLPKPGKNPAAEAALIVSRRFKNFHKGHRMLDKLIYFMLYST
ncbi:hypothetical protein HMPREF3293_00851 [Christensenella minuta]|uniref:Uncharacterized protein n=1 Tax=Christensenella minuta TaxID=626937 RepID=A0A136Q605_9FIRM|nr:hypothetical protein HMPREF3293_00851 [Christensenella minuta]